jgi:hypothetical protein
MAKYRSSIDFHGSPEVLEVFHQYRSRANDSSKINQNANWSKLLFNFVNGFANSFVVCCIQFPSFGFDSFFLAKLDGFSDITKIESGYICTSLCKVESDTLTDTSCSTCLSDITVGERTDDKNNFSLV